MRSRSIAALVAVLASAVQWPQIALSTDAVVVTATRVPQSSFDLPVSIDAFGQEQIQIGQPQVNLSETLIKVPGVLANNRQNYAQDLQISIRGFGARSTFGVRGVRLYADGIPLTMPDGQGQAANIDLSSARQIEVLRGPFSALYGNSSGGVINVFTEDGPQSFAGTASVWAGAFDSSRINLKLEGGQDSVNYLLDLSRFDTNGFRDHSAATRDTLNGKVTMKLGDASRLTFIANYLNQPDTQDPLGLTRAQMAQDREQAGTGAIAQNTRKSIENGQIGTVLEHEFSSHNSLRLLGYAGERSVRQFLALTFAGRGVVDLDRNFGGADARWTQKMTLAGMPFIFTAGMNYDILKETRKSFTNQAGQLGALGRDEDDTVYNLDPYVQAQWNLTDRWNLSAGLRHTQVRFETVDHFITDTNGDDSGRIHFSDTTPVAGVLFKASSSLNLYANAGQGFETPTFAELAYKSVSATDNGFNVGLKPATSRNIELGLKAHLGARAELTADLFRSRIHNEIVVLVNQGGRADYQNVDHTHRQGVELALDSDFEHGLHSRLAYTLLDAKFDSTFLTCGTSGACAQPTLIVPEGNAIPGVPKHSIYGDLSWSRRPDGFSTAIEARWMSRVFVNDLNDDSADAYTVLNWRAGLTQHTGGWSVDEFVRVENLLDRKYVGSVIVNASNGQYYEPAAGRSFLLGVSVQRY